GGVEYAADVTGGVAVFEDVILPAPGVYEGNVSYSGSDYYNPSNNTVDVVVSPLDTNITAVPVEGKVGDVVNVTAVIVDENGNPVLNGTAALVVGGVEYAADVIDGVAVFEDVILPAPGSYDGEIVYGGSDYYNPSNNTVDVVVSPWDTNITAVPVEGKVGDKVNVTVDVIDENGNLVLNGTAALVIGGVEYAADVIDGVAVFEDVILPAPGVYDGEIAYSGSDYYNPSNNTVDVVVSPLDTAVITAVPVEGKVGDVVNVTAVIVDENGNPVLNGTATLVIGGVVYTADVIDGVAVFEDVILPAPGSYECEITYNGSEKYNSSSTTVDIDVSALDTSIVAEPIEGKVGEKVSVTANVTDENGNPVPNGTATLSINGVEYTADILNGVVTFEGVVLPNTGNYTGQITYPGDKSYNPSETTIGVIVSKLDTTIEADDIIGYPSDIVDIVATVLDENGNPVLSGVAVLQVSDKIANLDKSAAGEYSAYVVNGKAVFKNVVLSTPGIYEGYLAYLGDATYNPSNNTMKITVLKVPVDISAEATSGKPGETVNVTVKVTPRDGTEFNGVVTVNLPDGTTRQVTITNGVGVTQWTIPDDFKEGKYEILVMFDGDDYYAAGNASAFVEVLKDNKTIPTDNETTPESKVIQQTLAKHETGNPILALLVILSIIGLIPLKRK
ncbi:hypothetical protein, partial [Methanobrevibacter sp.]|uniref:hypothetical protein n=1 Tax=Methanobrevibacter sp. TaxID=66852 RepID=UPI003870382F